MSDTGALAREILRLRTEKKATGLDAWAASGLAPRDEASAYAAQGALTALREAEGWTPIGYKIGATNQLARDLLSLSEPFYGRLFAESTDTSGAGSFELEPANHRVAEPEIAVVLGQDLAPGGAPFTAEDIAGATRGLIPVIEIVSSSFEDWMNAGANNLIADNGAHGSWFRGAEIRDWTGFDPLETEIRVSRTAGDDLTGRGAAVDGGAFGAAAWLANKLASQGIGLAAGSMISTGTTTPPLPLVAGDVIEMECGPLGKLSVAVT